jgi:TRAP-type mannitol/chloroaromatic compound transport system substrate-binding protein
MAPSRHAIPHLFALFRAIPFGLNQRKQCAWFYDDEGAELMNEFGKKFNFNSQGRHWMPDGRMVSQGN